VQSFQERWISLANSPKGMTLFSIGPIGSAASQFARFEADGSVARELKV
jgi:hypothetical protein